jgi:hypothetical protein
MAMNVTQARERTRLDQRGVERAAPDTSKSTVMLTTANSSLHGLLSSDNTAGTAGSMRVIEIIFRATGTHAKFEADQYWASLMQNHGHIGPAFMHNVIQRLPEVHAHVLETMRQIDALCEVAPSERFWSAACAVVLVAGEIASQMGLLPFNMVQLKNWIVTSLLPYERDVVSAQYSSSLTILMDYLEQINENILTTRAIPGEQFDDVLKEARGQLLARYDTDTQMMYVLKKGFRDHCTRVGANCLTVLNELNDPQVDGRGRPMRIVPIIDVRKVLGGRTRLAKGQSVCFAVNMAHPEVSGVFAHEVVETPEAERTPSRADLTVIKNPLVEPEPAASLRTDPAERKPRRALGKLDLMS